MAGFRDSKLFHILNWSAAAATATGVGAGFLWGLQKQGFPTQVSIAESQNYNSWIIDGLGFGERRSSFPLRAEGILGGIYNVTQCEMPSGERVITGKLQPGNFLNYALARPTTITYSASEYQNQPAPVCKPT